MIPPYDYHFWVILYDFLVDILVCFESNFDDFLAYNIPSFGWTGVEERDI